MDPDAGKKHGTAQTNIIYYRYSPGPRSRGPRKAYTKQGVFWLTGRGVPLLTALVKQPPPSQDFPVDTAIMLSGPITAARLRRIHTVFRFLLVLGTFLCFESRLGREVKIMNCDSYFIPLSFAVKHFVGGLKLLDL